MVEGESGGGWRKRNPIGGFKAVYVVIHGGSGWVPGSATANRQGGVGYCQSRMISSGNLA